MIPVGFLFISQDVKMEKNDGAIAQKSNNKSC